MGTARTLEVGAGAAYLTVDQTCAIMQLCRPALMRAIESGQIPAVKIGGVWRIRRAALDSLAAGAGALPTAGTSARRRGRTVRP